MHAEPFTCYRPATEAAEKFASLPYDVFDREGAAAYVEAHPKSFLAIDRPETAFGPDHDMYADDVYEKAGELLRERLEDGTLMRDGTPCYYLYRLRQGGHEQTGIVAACSVDDYTNNVIRRHELTRPEKERDRMRHIRATGCQTGPALLVYRDNPTLEALVEAAKAAEPLYDFYDDTRVRQTVWRVARPAAVEALNMMLQYVPCAYLADGHHRAASAVHVCQELRASSKGGTGTEPYNYLLGVLFPASQLTMLPYNRVIADTAGLTEQELVSALSKAGFRVGQRREKAVTPEEHGRFGMYAFGAWRELRLAKRVADAQADPVTSLDVSALQELVLGPILGVEDPRSDSRISFVGGDSGADELERIAGDAGVAFTLNATSMSELMSVADAGMLMPPKSTWFEPKLRSGLFIRRVCAGADVAGKSAEKERKN